jgi:hypothetical protein
MMRTVVQWTCYSDLPPAKIRVGFFLGAGCPLAVQISTGGKSEPIIPEIRGLTAQVKTHLLPRNTLTQPSTGSLLLCPSGLLLLRP